ncbi:GNAT family N-acetyltransferase [Pelagicoccus albus]|uniref:N-acetyltransferase n=1 Tax=Pelagicoccus albus TaxID=415222 RepID=A0A7X1B774_9BACT|nr:GNAT family N-acetyltransferase [Pelagicoccus albus]MBC2606797.1 N-acetyltransferase [Pelagicoccus albus]
MNKLVECKLERHGQAILEIFNHAIKTSTALYDYQERTWKDMETWFDVKATNCFPVIGLESEEGELLGFASFGRFRPHAGYLHTVEHSVYVDHRHRGKSLGKKLLRELIERAKGQSYHVMVGAIDSSNLASRRLHESFGFTHSGTLPQIGRKFDRWLDVSFYQLILEED